VFRRQSSFAAAVALAVVALSLASSARSAQAPAQPPAPGQAPPVPTFGVSTELVYVRFHVETKAGYVRDVKPDQIRVLEDGKPQKIVLLETPSTRERTVAPEVTLALDVSGSVMDAKLLDEALLRDVLFATLSEQATVGLCAFGGEMRCAVAPTRDVEALLGGFRESIEFGYQQRNQGTRLYASLADIARAPAKGEKVQRAVVVFSDGLENRGGKLDDAVRAASDADVRVYAVKLSQAFREQAIASGPFGVGRGGAGGSGGFGGRPGGTMYDYKKLELDELADRTGGRTFEPGTLEPAVLADILRRIATEITMECVVGYSPEGEQTGKRRKVKVEVVDKSLGKIRDGERTFAR
jgi:VWFA-related protein